MDAQAIVRARYRRAWARQHREVAAEGQPGVLMRGCWVVYASPASSQKLGWGADEQAAWQSAAARVLKEMAEAIREEQQQQQQPSGGGGG